jgi:hypothetical protein
MQFAAPRLCGCICNRRRASHNQRYPRSHGAQSGPSSASGTSDDQRTYPAFEARLNGTEKFLNDHTRYIITGAASGIGRAVAELAAEEGASLFLVDLNALGLEEVRDSLAPSASGIHIFAGDLADPAICQRVVDEAAEVMGGIDVLVSNAGVTAPGSLLDLTVERFDLSMGVNARATWLLGKAAHPSPFEVKREYRIHGLHLRTRVQRFLSRPTRQQKQRRSCW